YNGPIDYYVVEFDREKGKYLAFHKKKEIIKEIVGRKGKIHSSLYESMRKSGINPEIIIQFAEIFASKVDFFTDCQEGDEFAVLWEIYKDKNGKILKDVRVIAGKYKNSDHTYYAFYFKPEKGKGSYYDENGKSVESAFLRAPLNYRRISSYFSYRRFHPILKRYRPHLGIDYAAPKGTPVSAIGDGTVIFAGWTTNGYGIAVKIKHPNGYISYYGHLSKIRKGIRKGKRVRKGQVIGYVGMTGLATGPHLDFRLKKNGKFVNFLKLRMPPSYPLDKKYLPEFENLKKFYLSKFEEIPSPHPGSANSLNFNHLSSGS
ncbi:M23 family metallopeptidase, partial [bacterium]|nr:M23 family metallopeptidase [bacterium]